MNYRISRQSVQVTVILLVIFCLIGLFVEAIRKTHQAARRTQCQNNLKQLGFSLHSYHDMYKRLPTATIPHPTLPPEKRLSWVIEMRPYLESAPPLRLNRNEAWDAASNCPPRYGGFHMEVDVEIRPVGDHPLFLCPANPARNDASLPCPIHYVAIAGIGADAADLPFLDPRVGFLGNARQLKLADITDGTSATMALCEVLDGGLWTAGGRATLRALLPGDTPYLGDGGQFASNHGVGNALMADGSVREIASSTSTKAFERMATVAGRD